MSMDNEPEAFRMPTGRIGCLQSRGGISSGRFLPAWPRTSVRAIGTIALVIVAMLLLATASQSPAATTTSTRTVHASLVRALHPRFRVSPIPSSTLNLTVGKPRPSLNPVDNGSALTLNSTVAGGVRPYAVTWLGLPTNCTSQNTENLSCDPTSSGTFSIVVSVTDANGTTAKSANLTLQVSPQFFATPAISPSSGAAPLQVQFYSFYDGGTSPYFTTWSFGDGNMSSQPNATHTYRLPGAYGVDTWQNDSGGGALHWRLVVTVTAKPLEVTAPTPGSVDLGQWLNYSVAATGGTARNYTYHWSGLPLGCVPRDQPTLNSCKPSVTGTWNVSVTVNDSAGNLATNFTIFHVYSDPIAPALTASKKALDIGQSVTFNAITRGGSASYQFRWTGLPPGCTSVDSSRLDCQPLATGNYTVGLMVTDSDGLSPPGNSTNLTVWPSLVVGGPFPSKKLADVPESVDFRAQVYGGAPGGDVFDWSGLPPGCPSTNQSATACTFDTAGEYTVDVAATDAVGDIARGVQVTILVGATLSVSAVSATPSSIVIGQTFAINVTAKGGISPYRFVYQHLPSGCTSANSSDILCLPAATGNFTVLVLVADMTGSVQTANVSVTASPVSTTTKAASGLGIAGVIEFGAAISAGVIGLVLAYAHVSRRRKADGGSRDRADPEALRRAGREDPPAKPTPASDPDGADTASHTNRGE